MRRQMGKVYKCPKNLYKVLLESIAIENMGKQPKVIEMLYLFIGMYLKTPRMGQIHPWYTYYP